jgi:protein-S-isoprenylcysteine O-methyltransferase Ste14
MVRFPFLRTLILFLFLAIAMTSAILLWSFLNINDYLTKLLIGTAVATLLLFIAECVLPLDFSYLFERVMPITIVVYAALLVKSGHGFGVAGCLSMGLTFPIIDALLYPKLVGHREAKNWFLKMIVRWLVSFILSISLSLPALVLIVLSVKEINLATIFSLVIGFVGMVVLIISTLQLSVFNHKRDHQYAINNRGLWKVSRHPNYWGEMMLWWGIFLIMLSLDGSKWLLILGPLMLFLLNQYYRIPKLEKEWVEHNAKYTLYQQETNLLFPFTKPNNH